MPGPNKYMLIGHMHLATSDKMTLAQHRRDDIDGIRGVAILGVFLFHLFPKEVPGGFVGVDVFFVLSGYLITRHIKLRELRGVRDTLYFYWRRITRIWPSLFAMLLSLSPLLIFYGDEQRKPILLSMLYSLIGVSNVFFGVNSNYFDQEARLKPFLHTWSLSVEIQFYLLLPIVLMALKHIKYEKLACFLLAFSSFLGCFLTFADFPPYYNTFLRIFEFFCGTFVCLVPGYFQTYLVQSVFSALSFFGLWSYFVLFSNDSKFRVPGIGCVFPCLFTSILIKCPDSFVNKQVLSSIILQRIGRISYSLYLYHWPLIVYYQYILDKSTISSFDAFVITVLAFLLSYLGFTQIEKYDSRTIHRSWKLCGKYSYIIILIVLNGLLFSFISLSATPPSPEVRNALEKELRIYNSQNIIRQSFENIPAWKTTCGARQSNRTALIMGDSFAGSLVSFADYIGRKFDIVFHVWTISACSPLLNKDRVWLHSETPHWIDVVTSCGAIMHSWLLTVNESSYDTVFIAGKWKLYSFREPSDTPPRIKMIRLFKDSEERNVTRRSILTFGTTTPSVAEERKFFEESLMNVIENVSGMAKRVVLLSDIPALGPRLLSCEKYLSFKQRLRFLRYTLGPFFEQKINTNCIEQMSLNLSENLMYTNSITKNISSEIGILNIRPTEYLCRKPRQELQFQCYLRVGNKIIYKDSYHLNDAGGIFLAMNWMKQGKFAMLRK